MEKLSHFVQQPNAFMQERGMIALGRLGSQAQAAAPLVDRLIDESNFSQKPEAAFALWQITGETERTLEVLRQLMDDPTYENRVYDALTKMGSAAAPLAEQLAEKLKSEDQSLRLIVVEALAAMGAAARDQREALQASLQDADRDVALAIDRALVAIGKASDEELDPY